MSILTEDWSRIIQSSLLGAVWLCVASLIVWMLVHRKRGHTMLLVLIGTFAFFMCCGSYERALKIFLHGTQPYVIVWFWLATINGVWMVVYAWMNRFNLARTREDSEEKDLQRHNAEHDLEIDRVMAEECTSTALSDLRDSALHLKQKQRAILQGS